MKTFTPKTVVVFPKKKAESKAHQGSKAKAKKLRPHTQLVGPAGQEIRREWHVIDAKGQVLGRLASKVAVLLRGKHKPIFTPNVDVGDFVVIVNAGELSLTGQKATDKMLYRHSGYPGGLRADSYGDLREKSPELIVWAAVKRMLPRNKLRNKVMRKLKVYKGSEHPHVAQQPKSFDVSKVL